MSGQTTVWCLFVDPDDSTRPQEDVLPKVPQFAHEHDTLEDARAEAVRVLRKLRKSDGEHEWHAVCYRRTTIDRIAVGIGESVTIRLDD